MARIARQQYQLVDPGQQVYEVLPAPSASGGTDAGDPGQQAPVTPSGASELPAGSIGSADLRRGRHAGGPRPPARRRPPPAARPGVLGRILDTLEFWR